MNTVIQERLRALREAMAAAGIDYYMMPTADFHNSEYVNNYFKVREYFSNFSGSNGTLLVWQDGAGLWTDGRYFIQAERELEGTGIKLFRMLADGVPTMEEFLEQEMQEGQRLGFDGRVVSAAAGKGYEKKLTSKKISLVYDRDLAEEIWQDRPAFPGGKVTLLAEKLTGKSTAEKLRSVREKMEAEGASSLLLTKLDDIMWLFNIRGCDVECNPVAMSYAYITGEQAVLFLQKEALDEQERAYFGESTIEVREYHTIVEYLKSLPAGGKVLLDDRNCSYALYRTLQKNQTLVEKKNPTELLKAMKNPTELRSMEEIYLKDSVAVTRFIYWLKQNIGKREITEISAAEHLEQLRRQIPEFLDLSFETISGYGEHGAIVHYSVTTESDVPLRPEGMLLVDSGGQYQGGTTDVTRTIVLGNVTDEMKKCYTLVAAGMLQLSAARWIYGCTGRNLDILARQPLWNAGLDYNHGTGHGVGCMLNVHEGPQNIGWRYTEGMTEAVIEEGMVVSNEPGVYLEGRFGIRIENILTAQKDEKNEYGQFMHFDTLTWVPLDMAAIDERYLTDTSRALLYGYQRAVYEKLSPYLSEEERTWLREETRADSTVFLGH